MENFSSFSRVVGKISEKEKRDILKEKSKQFNNQYFEESVSKEKEKTNEELQIIGLANRLTNDVRKKYGLDDFDIPPENIHIIKESEWPTEKEEQSAFYSPIYQAVAIREQYANVVFMEKIVHEMLHFKSYNSLQLTNVEDADFHSFRVGLVITTRDGENMYLGNLNEAVTEEIVKNILKGLIGNPLFIEDILQTNEIIDKYPDAKTNKGADLFSEDTFYAKMGKEPNEIIVENFTFKREREILEILINKLFERNKGKFKSREDIFEIFSRAMMTGKIIFFAKLIDGTFGKGTLRKIGELDGDLARQEKFVLSL